jgi:tetratricopeptide (TPR) repeat protein
MTRRSRTSYFAPFTSLILALALSTFACATGVADGEAGLQAFNRGAYDEAIRLFTRALNARDLSQDDREFAYFNRGNAYLRKGDATDAVADLREAVRISPADADAQGALREALAGQARRAPESRTVARLPDGGRWGLLGSMVGRYYWYQIAGVDPHKAVVHVEWATPDQTLSISIRSKAGLVQVVEYQFDVATGKLLTAAVAGKEVFYGTAEVSGTALTGYSYFKNTPIKDSLTIAADGSLREHEQHFSDGIWNDSESGNVLFVEVSQEILEAQGFLKHHR